MTSQATVPGAGVEFSRVLPLGNKPGSLLAVDVADAHRGLGILCACCEGDNKAAREHYEKNLAITQTALGPEHVDVAGSPTRRP